MILMKSSPLLLAALVTVLAGCAANPYVSPTGEHLATVRVVTEAPGSISLATFEEGEFCRGIRPINEGNPKGPWLDLTHPSVTFKVVPQDTFTLQIVAGRKHTNPMLVNTCYLTLSFALKADTEYDVVFDWPASQCGARISERTDGPDGKVQRQVAGRQREFMCMDTRRKNSSETVTGGPA